LSKVAEIPHASMFTGKCLAFLSAETEKNLNFTHIGLGEEQKK